MGDSDIRVAYLDESEETYDDEATYKKEEINKLHAINEAIYKEYEVENDRIKLIDDRSGSLFNIAGIVVTFATTVSIKKEIPLPYTFKVVEILLTIAIMGCLCASVVFLLMSLRTRSYERPNLVDFTKGEFKEKDLYDTLSTIEVTYIDLIKKNKLTTDKKVKHFNRGTLFLGLGFILVIVRFFLFFLFEVQ